MKIFVVDVEKCVGCRSCQLVCKDEHCDNDWMPYAAPQPDTGQFWMRVDEKERGQVPKVTVAYTPIMCQHCENAPCMAAAKDGAVYRRDDGLVVVDPAKAKGQKAIVEACPYNAVFWNEELEIPQKCTGCAHLLDEGWKVPRCVEACAHDALRFGDFEDFKDELEAAELLKPDANTKPHVYYLNLPKRFIGGEIADLEKRRSSSAPRWSSPTSPRGGPGKPSPMTSAISGSVRSRLPTTASRSKPRASAPAW